MKTVMSNFAQVLAELKIDPNFSFSNELRLVELISKHKFHRVLQGHENRKSTWNTTPLVMTVVPSDERRWMTCHGGHGKSWNAVVNDRIGVKILEDSDDVLEHSFKVYPDVGTVYTSPEAPQDPEYGHYMVPHDVSPGATVSFSAVSAVAWIHHADVRDGVAGTLFGTPISVKYDADETVQVVKDKCIERFGMKDRPVEYGKWNIVLFNTRLQTATNVEQGT